MRRRAVVVSLGVGIASLLTATPSRSQTVAPGTPGTGGDTEPIVQHLTALLPIPTEMVPTPAEGQAPWGSNLTVIETGALSAVELAATFPDPADAAAMLATWGWAGNAYRVYGGPDDDQLEISLHQFTRSTDAAVALGYFVHGRMVMLGDSEQPLGQGSPCDVILAGETSVTRYVRAGNLLLRVTDVLPNRPPPYALMAGMPVTYWAADAVMHNAGTSMQEIEQSCQ